MSAPNEGRQSPEPEQQSGKQQQDIPSQGMSKQGDSGKMDNSKQKNEGKDDQTSGLESNPKHVLQDAAEEKTAKTVS